MNIALAIGEGPKVAIGATPGIIVLENKDQARAVVMDQSEASDETDDSLEDESVKSQPRSLSD